MYHTECIFCHSSVLNSLISRNFYKKSWRMAVKLRTYSVSTLETTIFREIISLVRVNSRFTFLSSCLSPYFKTLMGGNTYPLLPPIRVSKYEISEELRKVHLKLTLTNEIISRKIVISRLETL